MNIIVFGGRGFLGRSFFNEYKEKCDNLIVINEINNLTDTILKQSNILINFAGSSNIQKSYIDPLCDFISNTKLVELLLEKIKNSNRRIKFINLSSAAVYGNPVQIPISEKDKLRPISPYGFHKKMSEDICKMYYQCYGIKTMSLRLFSVYGNGQNKMLFWDLHQKIKDSNNEVVLFGTGKESRDFIHLEDLFVQILLAMENSNFNGEVVNVANGKEVRVVEVVQIFQMYYPKKFSFNFSGESRIGDPLNWCADISTMKNWGYQQKVGIEEGLKKYINWVTEY